MSAARARGGAHVAIVIPSFQAEGSIAAVIHAVPAIASTIIVVDDASSDGTARAAMDSGDARVVVTRHEQNRGVGAATMTGYREALARGADIVVKIDADGQMDMGDLPRLLQPILEGRADYAKGNRFSTSSHLSGMPALRLVGNAGLSFLIKLASGAWHVFDPTNGYTAVHRRALEVVDLRRVSERYYFESSLLAALTVARAVIEDVPMRARYGGETSHLSLRRALIEFPPQIARTAAWRFVKSYLVHDFNACSVLVLLGLPAFTFGVLDGLAVWARAASSGQFAATGAVIIPTIATILGFQMLLHALLLDVGSTPRRPLQASSGPPDDREPAP